MLRSQFCQTPLVRKVAWELNGVCPMSDRPGLTCKKNRIQNSFNSCTTDERSAATILISDQMLVS